MKRKRNILIIDAHKRREKGPLVNYCHHCRKGGTECGQEGASCFTSWYLRYRWYPNEVGSSLKAQGAAKLKL